MKKHAILSAVIVFVYIILFISVFFSFRAITSICIVLLLTLGIIKQNGNIKNCIRLNNASWLLAGTILFFLLQFVPLLYTNNIQEEWKNILLKSSMVAIPLAVMLSGPFEKQMQKKLLQVYCLPLLIAGLYCLCKAFLLYSDTGDTSIFFYHELVNPLQQHAIYFSIYVFISLVFLLENLQKKTRGVGNIFLTSMIVFLSILLFLLSSKLVISFYVLYLLYYLISLVKRTAFSKKIVIGSMISVVVVISIVFFTNNPVSKRFRDLATGDLAFIKQDQYTPGDYFNGIQFRLLQWKLVPEILNKHNGWWKGVGANAQDFLDEEYISKNMYLGDPSTGNRGYREYNTHNQFLESLLSNGIPGLMIMLFIYFILIKLIVKTKRRDISFIIVLLLIYGAIESVFETQYGIFLFTFFPAFLCQEGSLSQPLSRLSRL